jgi:methylmalonyl-CoA/ethylmalonyl-CoA epimerase
MGGSGAPHVPPAAGIIGLSHIAIATRDADADAARWIAALGGTRGAEEMLDHGALRVLFVSLGPVTLELLEPRSADHTVARFLETRGPGLHHVSYEVADLTAALERCRSAGIRLIDETPRAGAHGSRVAFLHPKSVGGVLIELCESRRRI